MSDPVRIFLDAEPWRRESLKSVWPDLYDALAPPAADRKAWGCGFHFGEGERGIALHHPVVGRIWLNGPPACAECIKTKSRRKGGYPLDRVDPREWRE